MKNLHMMEPGRSCVGNRSPAVTAWCCHMIATDKTLSVESPPIPFTVLGFPRSVVLTVEILVAKALESARCS